MIDKYFSELLSEAMDLADCTSDKELESLLKSSGNFNISRSSITQYHSGMIIPPFLKAKAILDVLEYSMDDQELTEVLEESKENSKQVKELYGYAADEKARKTVVLNYGQLMRGYESFESMEILNKRIEELYGNETSFSAYVNSLIRKDLAEYIISKEEIEGDLNNE